MISTGLFAQQAEPVEIFESPMIVAYHICQWDEKEVLLNADVLGDGRYIIRMDEEGNDLEMDRWHLNTNTCSFLTESKFFRDSEGEICFYYVKGPDRPIVCKVTISDDFELTTFEFPEAFPFPEEITPDNWWQFEWLPNDDGSTFVSGVYLEGDHSVQMMVRYNEAGEITHQWEDITGRATTCLLPPAQGFSGCRLVMEDLTAKDVNSECVIFDDNLNVVDIKHSIYNQAIGVYRPQYEYFTVHPETDMVYLLSDVNFPAFNGNPEITADIYMSQFDADFTQTKYVVGPYTYHESDQKALCEAIDFHGEEIYMCGFMNTWDPYYGGDMEKVCNFYVALLDGNLNIKGEVYYHNEERMLTPYSIYALSSGGCLVSTDGKDRRTGELQHTIYKLSDETIVGIEEAHDAGFAVAVAYPNPGKDVLNIRTGLQDARVEVYDVNGKLVHSQEIAENVTSINAEAWAEGVYVWKVYSGVSTLRCFDKLSNRSSATAGSTTLAESGKWIKE